MKKILILLTALITMASCSMDNDTQEFELEFLPVLSVEAPQSVTPGQTANFKVFYKRPTDCYFVNGFDYTADGAIRNVALQAIVIQDADCLSLENTAAESINLPFQCPPVYSYSAYLFRFYQGKNADTGENQYLEIEVPVAQ
ncbi:MAG: hypothetical protein V4581_17425 [Bacteroidota bacterium]